MQLYSIITRQMANRRALDFDTNGGLVIRIVVLSDKPSSDRQAVFPAAPVASSRHPLSLADVLKDRLVEVLADDPLSPWSGSRTTSAESLRSARLAARSGTRADSGWRTCTVHCIPSTIANPHFRDYAGPDPAAAAAPRPNFSSGERRRRGQRLIGSVHWIVRSNHHRYAIDIGKSS